MNSLGSAVDDSLNLYDVGLPSSVGASVGVRYLDTEGNALTANITFCHWDYTSLRIGVMSYL